MTTGKFAAGADISWYPQMRKAGFIFRDRMGTPRELLDILKDDYRLDAIRLRIWVDPSDDPRSGHCSAAETAQFARECQDKGFRVMIDFHYGDTWCDPEHQEKPRRWMGLAFHDLADAVYQYTYDTVKLLCDGGAFPEWVQIGNETNPGMLLPDGSTSDFDKLVKLYNAGNDGAKAASPGTKTVIHLAEICKTDFILGYVRELERRDCRYDMLGFSHYPATAPGMTAEECTQGFRRSLEEIPARLQKEFMLVEFGVPDNAEEEAYRLAAQILHDTRSQSHCHGAFIWEPEGAKIWSYYPMSAWRADGTPAKTMEAFLTIK